jgi:hypothetical protein
VERNGGKRLADNQRRNLSGMGGRFLETTNAWSITDDSVAQDTFENPVGVFVDYPAPIGGSVKNKAERRKAMRHAYGDSVRNGPSWRGWVDLDRIDVEIDALSNVTRPRPNGSSSTGCMPARTSCSTLRRGATPPAPTSWFPTTLIAIGVDGARWEDAVAVIAMTVDGFHAWPLHRDREAPRRRPRLRARPRAGRRHRGRSVRAVQRRPAVRRPPEDRAPDRPVDGTVRQGPGRRLRDEPA